MTPTNEERTLAALAHSSILLIPMAIWIHQRSRSRYASGQALQAAFLGVGVVAALNGALVLIFGFFYWMVRSLEALPSDSSSADAVEEIFAAFQVFPVIFLGLGLLFLLALVALKVWAVARTAQGQPFRYPLLGTLVEWLDR